MVEAKRPLLIFPAPADAKRGKRQGGGGRVDSPPRGRQIERLTPKLDRLTQAMEAERLRLQATAEGTEPELVLVIELAVPVSTFRGALEKVGLEWMDETEWEMDPDEDFFTRNSSGEAKSEAFRGQLYLTLTDQTALRKLLAHWKQWRDRPHEPWAHGENAWKKVFPNIRDIRPWSEQDRLRDTGLVEAWQERLEEGEEQVRFEAKLWFRDNPQ